MPERPRYSEASPQTRYPRPSSNATLHYDDIATQSADLMLQRHENSCTNRHPS